MADSDTLWLQQKLNRNAQSQAMLAIEQTGRALPCKVTKVNGSLVTVSFEVDSGYTLPPVQMPKAESQWMRAPTQIGDFGLTVPADTFLGGISGLGSGVATLGKQYGNLSALVWIPVAGTGFTAPPRASIAWPNGPHGARLGDSASTAYIDCNPDTGTVTIAAGGKAWTFTAAGLTMSSGVIAETHVHPGVTGGSSDTGGPIA